MNNLLIIYNRNRCEVIRIQHAFLRCYYTPAFEMCRKRLLREFNEMNEELKITIRSLSCKVFLFLT
jgi:hypothetical protein